MDVMRSAGLETLFKDAKGKGIFSSVIRLFT